MPSAGPDFSRLHELLQKLKQVQDQLLRGPRQIKQRQKRVGDAQNELSLKESELKSLRAETDRKNLDLKSKEAHLLDLKRKLNSAASNREYEIITGQVDADIAAKAVLEDEVLEYLDRVDALQQEVEVCRVKITEYETDARLFAIAFEEKVAELHKQEQDLKVRATAAEEVIPKPIREQFDRLVQAYGPEAMAECRNGVCTNCFVQLTPQNKVLINSGKAHFCGSCGRLIYLLSDE